MRVLAPLKQLSMSDDPWWEAGDDDHPDAVEGEESPAMAPPLEDGAVSERCATEDPDAREHPP
jgi:hypothetical protein